MIEILDAPDHVLAVKMSGTLTGEDYSQVIQAVEDKLARHPKIGVYADTTEFSDMTVEAMLKDVRYNLAKLGQWSRFPRAAMVTDKQWLQGLIGALDPLIPQVEAHAFEPGQEAEALAWAAAVRS